MTKTLPVVQSKHLGEHTRRDFLERVSVQLDHLLKTQVKSRVKADKFENPETMLGTQKACLAFKPKCLSNKPHVLKAHFLARLMYHRRSLKAFVCFFNLFKAELSQKRYWQGPRSQELGEEGDFLLTATLSPPE